MSWTGVRGLSNRVFSMAAGPLENGVGKMVGRQVRKKEMSKIIRDRMSQNLGAVLVVERDSVWPF